MYEMYYSVIHLLLFKTPVSHVEMYYVMYRIIFCSIFPYIFVS